MRTTITKTKTKTARRSATAAPALNPPLHPDAAGIDVGAKEFVAALPPGRAAVTVATFKTFTSGVHALRDWLLAHGIKTVAMESTGNYWITLYDTLAEAGIEVFLVNARHVKGVPGQKTDVQDAVWLQQLHAAGLLRKSYRPAPEIVPLRYLMRHRADLVAQAAQQVHLMQKSLTEMNLKLQQVFSDIDGRSAQAIIDAILAGERDPARLAALRHQRCQAEPEDIKEALRGDYRSEYLFVLRQSQAPWRHLQEAISQCDAELGALSAKVSRSEAAALPAAPARQRRLHKNHPQYRLSEGMVAAAHKLARIIYAMIEKQEPWSETKAFEPSPRAAARRLQRLHKQAHALGYELTPVPANAA